MIILGDELLHQRLAHDIGLGVTRDAGGTLVPLIDQASGVDAENGGIGRIDQLGQVLCNLSLLQLRVLSLGDIAGYRQGLDDFTTRTVGQNRNRILFHPVTATFKVQNLEDLLVLSASEDGFQSSQIPIVIFRNDQIQDTSTAQLRD